MQAGDQAWLSGHAQSRCQQRGIRTELGGVMVEHGERKYTREERSYSMSHRASKRVKAAMCARIYSCIADKLDFYVVVSLEGDDIITVARLIRCFRKN